jgi:hypothetical protein
MRDGATFNDFSVCSATVSGSGAFTFNDSATGGLTADGGWPGPAPALVYNDKSYGSGVAARLTISGAAIMQNADLDAYNSNVPLNYSFTRPQYGINGSSILGVI